MLVNAGAMGELREDLDTLYKVAAVAKLGIALQTLNLLYQVLQAGFATSAPIPILLL